MAKRLLILKASSDVCAAEVSHILTIAHLFGMEHDVAEVGSNCDLYAVIPTQQKYDYVYLAAHANPECFGESDGTCLTTWDNFATILCELNCLSAGCVLLLGCCRGGLRSVAHTLFYYCCQIDYVCGPRWTVTKHDITTGFHVFIYNMESRREQPSTSAKRASDATGYEFFCYDRVEMEDQYNQVHGGSYPSQQSQQWNQQAEPTTDNGGT